jgi:hypothetical protein
MLSSTGICFSCAFFPVSPGVLDVFVKHGERERREKREERRGEKREEREHLRMDALDMQGEVLRKVPRGDTNVHSSPKV